MAATPTFYRSTFPDAPSAASRGPRASETGRDLSARATDESAGPLPVLEPKWIDAIEKATD